MFFRIIINNNNNIINIKIIIIISRQPTCTNHDDNVTGAIIQCSVCGNLCADCDRYLHLHRRTRMHQRQVCKEEEEAIKVDLHEGESSIKIKKKKII